jgi:hypothetical protein
MTKKIRGNDGCLCKGAGHWPGCDRPDVVAARAYEKAAPGEAGKRTRRAAVRVILRLILVAHPDGGGKGGHDAARYVEEAGRCEEAAGAARLLLRAVEVAVGAGAAASEMGDLGRRAAWCRVRDVGVMA